MLPERISKLYRYAASFRAERSQKGREKTGKGPNQQDKSVRVNRLNRPGVRGGNTQGSEKVPPRGESRERREEGIMYRV